MRVNDVKSFYELLGHRAQTEIRVFELMPDMKSSKCVGHYFVSSWEEFFKIISQYDGKYNLYAGLNERTDKGTEAKDVKSVKRVFVDIDCINKPAIPEDLKEAEKIAREIVSKIEEYSGLKGTIIFSGNGYQLIFCIPEIALTEQNREEIEAKVQQFLKDLIKRYNNDKVKLDNVGDLPRIIRITGTINIKGGKTSEFIEVHNQDNEKLKDYILNLKLEDNMGSVKVGELETSLKEILEKDERVKKLFEGDTKGFTSRSEAELSLVCHLVGLGFDKEQIFKVMASCKIGKWQSANIQYRELTYKKAVEKISKEKQDKTKYHKIKLSDLNASLINKLVSVDCQITGEQTQMAIPIMLKFACSSCGAVWSLDLKGHEKEVMFNELNLRNKCLTCKVEAVILEQNYIDYSIIYARDLLDRDSLTAVKRYDSKRVYVINQTLPNSKTINIKGKVFIEPKTKNISIMCDSINQLENQVEEFTITEQFKENSKKYFGSGSDLTKQINPDIVGQQRDFAKQSLLLQLHSPCKIKDITRKKLIRGGVNVIFYGDTKCGKSEIAKDVTQKGSMPVGEYTICETGGRTGFLYTIDRDKGSLIWGSLALNDMGLVVLDGLQSMHSEELGEFREAIEQQEIIVRRSITGEALARTRIIGSLNPNKPMINYIYKCQALQDTYVFAKSPEFTRWDLFIPFCQRDVSGKEIAHRKAESKPIPEDIFIKHIYWVWSRKPEQIIYTESAVKKINDLSEECIKEFSLETLPIVHNGIRDIITRLAVAYACQVHSTDETHEKVIVETEHVDKVVKWYMQILDMLEIGRYKQDTEGKSDLSDNECLKIASELGEVELRILQEIKHEPKSSTQLAGLFELSDRTIKEHYKLLKKHGLIDTKQKQGVSLSVRGVKFVRWGILGSGEIGKKNDTIKNIGEEKLHHCTNEESAYGSKNDSEKAEDIDFSELDEEVRDDE